MKKLLLPLFGLLLASSLMQAQTTAPRAIFVVVDTKPDKSPQDVAKDLNKDINKVLKKLKGADVSEQSKSGFAAQFGNIPDVQWERQDYFDVANFTKDGQKMKAYFDVNGELVGTITDKTFEDLPAKAREYIQKKYPDHIIGDVIMYTDNQNEEGDILLFGTEMESATNYFVELRKDNKRIILKVSPDGDVSFFKELKS
jgi:hypothetical protein